MTSKIIQTRLLAWNISSACPHAWHRVGACRPRSFGSYGWKSIRIIFGDGHCFEWVDLCRIGFEWFFDYHFVLAGTRWGHQEI